jgi:hypothetical protein
MRPDDVRQLLQQRPFFPFRLYVSDGSHYDVTHPEAASIQRGAVRVGLPAGGVMHPPGERVAFVSFIHLCRIEVFFPGAAPAA